MTPENQIRSLAKIQGIADIHSVPGRGLVYGANNCEYKVPNYLASLDAIHEVEKELTKDEWLVYQEMLYLIGRREGVDSAMFASKYLIHARAEHKVEAILRAKGLWTDLTQ